MSTSATASSYRASSPTSTAWSSPVDDALRKSWQWAKEAILAADDVDALPLLEWTQQRRPILKEGVPFDLPGHLYLREIYECQAEQMVVFKASQMGVSEYAISYAFHAADVRQATVLYVFPTDSTVSDFSSARIGPAIDASEYLAGIVVEGGKRGADRVTLKRVRNRFLYLRGGVVKPDGNAPQLKSIDADVLILDEVDEMDARAPGIAVKRLGHSSIAEQRWISTPTYPGIGIHAAWLDSDQREWCIPCPACGQRQYLTIGHIVHEWDDLERPTVWHGQDEDRAYAACERCGAELDRMVAGEWAAMNPGSAIVGYHPTRLFSPRSDLLTVVRALQTVDETKRKEAFNQDLGLPYRPRGGGLDDAELDACRREYAHGAQAGEQCVMGVDVGRVLHVVIRGHADTVTGERPQRWAGAVSQFEELAELIRRFRVTATVIDALPETRKAREFQAVQAPGTVWLAYYDGGTTGTKDEEAATWSRDKGVVTIDRTRLMDETFSRFYGGEAAVNTLPGHARNVPDYYAHLKAPVRTTDKNARGEVIARYVETGPDHFSHAEVYCTAAAMQPTYGGAAGLMF